ncbi:hypothetical protein SDC9_164180 [bioreactor metagenome]|uniref:Uncharacterized protein n=1 Tax=bioreactor metagenome TaxID=1076179 RepID=A0A645FY51_9ZZZZ
MCQSMNYAVAYLPENILSRSPVITEDRNICDLGSVGEDGASAAGPPYYCDAVPSGVIEIHGFFCDRGPSQGYRRPGSGVYTYHIRDTAGRMGLQQQFVVSDAFLRFQVSEVREQHGSFALVALIVLLALGAA